jgi:hypothetical protein
MKLIPSHMDVYKNLHACERLKNTHIHKLIFLRSKEPNVRNLMDFAQLVVSV